jgi:hypothetical protein
MCISHNWRHARNFDPSRAGRFNHTHAVRSAEEGRGRPDLGADQADYVHAITKLAAEGA